MEILHIENISFKYPLGRKNAVENCSLSVNEGEFVVLCGKSGCGKTTLLKLMKKELSPHGEMSGSVLYKGEKTDSSDFDSSSIGFVMQNPDSQIVTDKVWHELAFGLENMGVDTPSIRRRVGEMASYFGIESWYHSDTDKLSGGQKQLLNLASIMVMQPNLLILDEPTSQLDPVAAADFISTLKKLNAELGLTIIISEHRLEDVFCCADKVVLMDNGEIIACGTPHEVGEMMRGTNSPMLDGLPSAVRIYSQLDVDTKCPLTVREGREFLKGNFKEKFLKNVQCEYSHNDDIAIQLENCRFRYDKNADDVLRDADLKIYKGEIFCILGGNGSGKTTCLNVIAGLSKAYMGKVKINGKKISSYHNNSLYRNLLSYLPQNPSEVFICDTVEADYKKLLEAMDIKGENADKEIQRVSNQLDIAHLLECHPYDISGGEQQKAALGKLLLTNPKILLLDEPTKGLDACSKNQLTQLLKEMTAGGMTVAMVTHDVEFAAESADRCGLCFDGEILSASASREFFAGNNFYTTAANRISRGIFQNCVLCSDVVAMCKGSARTPQ